MKLRWRDNDHGRRISEDVRLFIADLQIQGCRDLAVLTLYRAQVKRLREFLPKVEISSVDGFQGKEADVIIVSTVRAKGKLGKKDRQHVFA